MVFFKIDFEEEGCLEVLLMSIIFICRCMKIGIEIYVFDCEVVVYD